MAVIRVQVHHAGGSVHELVVAGGVPFTWVLAADGRLVWRIDGRTRPTAFSSSNTSQSMTIAVVG